MEEERGEGGRRGREKGGGGGGSGKGEGRWRRKGERVGGEGGRKGEGKGGVGRWRGEGRRREMGRGGWGEEEAPANIHGIRLKCHRRTIYHRGSQPPTLEAHMVGVDQEGPSSSPGSTDPDKPEPLTEKQLKEVPVAVDVFGMETVSDDSKLAWE